MLLLFFLGLFRFFDFFLGSWLVFSFDFFFLILWLLKSIFFSTSLSFCCRLFITVLSPLPQNLTALPYCCIYIFQQMIDQKNFLFLSFDCMTFRLVNRSELYELIDLITLENIVSLSEDVLCDLDHKLIIRIDCGFDFFIFELSIGCLFDFVDLIPKVLEESAQIFMVGFPCSLTFAKNIVVIFFEYAWIDNEMLLKKMVILIDVLFRLLAVLLAPATRSNVHNQLWTRKINIKHSSRTVFICFLTNRAKIAVDLDCRKQKCFGVELRICFSIGISDRLW